MESICTNCGKFVKSLDNNTGWCRVCSSAFYSAAEKFLLTNADHIEYYMLQGKSLNQAIDLLRSEIKHLRTCASCGGVISRAARGVVFCRKTPQCRRTVRRYVYLYERKGLTKPEALATVLEEINGGE